MTDHSINIFRRTLLGVALASLLTPRALQAQEKQWMQVRFTFADQDFTATLFDNPSSRDFASMLPLDLTVSDFASNEKLAYLPRKINLEARGPFPNAAPGDLCYFIPWGNLAMFHGSYESTSDLIRLGRFNDGFQPLLKRGEFPLRIEAIA